MKNFILLICLCISVGVYAQAPTVQNEAAGFLSYNEQRVMSLADAFSDEQYDWAPGEGVRSVRESLLHLAAANYFFMMSAGFAVPEDVNVMTMESDIKGKENVKAALTKSYNYIREQISQIPDENLGDEVNFPFPGEYTKMSAIILSVDHSSEHLGQLIAYARMNGITPPWSEGQGEGK